LFFEYLELYKNRVAWGLPPPQPISFIIHPQPCPLISEPLKKEKYLSLGGKVNTRRIPQPDMESIFTKIIYEIFWSYETVK